VCITSFMSFSTGAGVVVSQCFGAHRHEDVRRAVHTIVALTLIFAVVLTALGIIFTPTMLRLMKMPASVFDEAQSYLTIYFAGMVGLLFYNMGASILRAVGDSRRPFIYLVVAAVINVILDFVFVIGFEKDVEGVAYATIIAQGVSATLTVYTLLRSDGCIRVNPKHIHIDWKILRSIVNIGIPAAIQSGIICFSNVFVQSYINFFGEDYTGGWAAHTKIDQFAVLPMQSIGLATTTFVGQNLGSGQRKRAYDGVRVALIMAIVVTACISAILGIFARPLVSFFVDNEAIRDTGTLYLRTLTPYYVLFAFNHIYTNALRGAGNARAPMIILLISYALFRQIYLFVVSNYISNTIVPIIMCFPAAWLACSLITTIYFHRVHLKKDDKKL